MVQEVQLKTQLIMWCSTYTLYSLLRDTFETWWWPSTRAETCSLSNKYYTALLVVFSTVLSCTILLYLTQRECHNLRFLRTHPASWELLLNPYRRMLHYRQRSS